jgi:hypothetical protein
MKNFPQGRQRADRLTAKRQPRKPNRDSAGAEPRCKNIDILLGWRQPGFMAIEGTVSCRSP